MNFKNIFKKNQIIIYTLALMLVSAGYLNYTSKVENSEIETSTQDVESGALVENKETQALNSNIEKEGEKKKEETALVPNDEESVKTNSNTEEGNKTKNDTNNVDGKNTSIKENNKGEDKKLAAIGDATLVNSNDIVEDDYFAKSKLERESMYSQMQETYQTILNSPNSAEAQKEMASVEMAKINETKNCIMICENLLETKGFKNCVIFVNEGSVSVIIGAKELKPDQTAQIQNIISRELGAIVENIHISVK